MLTLPSRRADGPLPSLLPALFFSEERYGWSMGMRRITLALLAQLPVQTGPAHVAVDLGCGGGSTAAATRQAVPLRAVIGLDRHPLAVQLSALRLPGSVLQGEMEQLPLGDASIGLCLALDSLDQRGVDLPVALREIHRVLAPGGFLLARVSAVPRLSGPHDQAFNTARRYAAATLVQAVTQAGLAVQRTTHANLLLGLPVAFLRLLQRWGWLPLWPALYANSMANRLLAMALTAEARHLRRRNLPFGLSLYLIARKELP